MAGVSQGGRLQKRVPTRRHKRMPKVLNPRASASVLVRLVQGDHGRHEGMVAMHLSDCVGSMRIDGVEWDLLEDLMGCWPDTC
jgi:hypothetical protein